MKEMEVELELLSSAVLQIDADRFGGGRDGQRC
jgi:hypothetical protein